MSQFKPHPFILFFTLTSSGSYIGNMFRSTFLCFRFVSYIAKCINLQLGEGNVTLSAAPNLYNPFSYIYIFQIFSRVCRPFNADIHTSVTSLHMREIKLACLYLV